MFWNNLITRAGCKLAKLIAQVFKATPLSHEEAIASALFMKLHPERLVRFTSLHGVTDSESVVYVYYQPTKLIVQLPAPYAVFMINHEHNDVCELDLEKPENEKWKLKLVNVW